MLGNENIRTWEQFKELGLEQQLRIINELLEEGYSIPKISSSLEGKIPGKGVDRGVIGKHFKKNNYEYNREENKFVIIDPSVVIGSYSNKKSNHTMREKKETISVAGSYRNKADREASATNIVTDSYNTFEEDEINVLKQLIQEVKLRNSIVDPEAEAGAEKGETANRNIRVYKDQYKEFAAFCSTHNLKQCDALYKAINMLMSSYK